LSFLRHPEDTVFTQTCQVPESSLRRSRGCSAHGGVWLWVRLEPPPDLLH
jgi:hypothetical protein